MSRVSLGAALAALLLAAPAPTQEQRAVVPPDGTQYFRNLLHLHGLKPLPRASDLAQAQPRETLLIVFGSLEGLDAAAHRPGGLRAFVNAGGAVLIASDRRDAGWGGRLNELGLFLSGRDVLAPPEHAYRGTPECPLLQQWRVPNHPIFAGITEGIATNRPSHVRPAFVPPGRPRFAPPGRPALIALASFPPGCHDRFDVALGNAAFIVGTSADADSPGKILVVAGHGTFINDMMAAADNAVFARNCVHWLTDQGKRKHVLFVEDGEVLTGLNVPLTRVPVPPLKVVNRALRAMEEENLFNRLLLDNVGRERVLRVLLVGASVLLAFCGLYRLVRAHHRGEPAGPLVAVRVGQDETGVPLAVRRHRAQVVENNFAEAARDLARLCFEESAGARPAAPPTVVRGGRRLRRLVARLWRVAYGEPEPVSARRFEGVAVAAGQVRAALADGSLRFEGAR